MSERWAIVDGEDGAPGYLQDLVALEEGEGRGSWGRVVVQPYASGHDEEACGTLLLEGEAAIIVTCRADDRAKLMAWLVAMLNAGEGSW